MYDTTEKKRSTTAIIIFGMILSAPIGLVLYGALFVHYMVLGPFMLLSAITGFVLGAWSEKGKHILVSTFGIGGLMYLSFLDSLGFQCGLWFIWFG